MNFLDELFKEVELGITNLLDELQAQEEDYHYFRMDHRDPGGYFIEDVEVQ